MEHNEEHPQKKIERLLVEKQDQENGVYFNEKPCRNGCNCAEVEEYHYGNEALKRGFQCLVDKKDRAQSKTPIHKGIDLSDKGEEDDDVKTIHQLKEEIRYYRCNKCGQSVTQQIGAICLYPMPVRTSGICAGSCTVEISKYEYNKIAGLSDSSEEKEVILKFLNWYDGDLKVLKDHDQLVEEYFSERV